MNEIAFIYTLFPDAVEAKQVSETLLSENLVACVNRMAAVTSHYMWQGRMQSEEEFPVIMKTSPEKLADAMARLRRLHNYDLPPVSGWKADASPDFAEWAARETGVVEVRPPGPRPTFR